MSVSKQSRWKDDKVKPQYPKKNLCQCHPAHHKSQVDWPNTAPVFRGERPVFHYLNYGMSPLSGPHSHAPFTRLRYKLTAISPCASFPEIPQLFFQYSTCVNGAIPSTIKPRAGKRNMHEVVLYIRSGIETFGHFCTCGKPYQ
jgi:hypothetical protein